MKLSKQISQWNKSRYMESGVCVTQHLLPPPFYGKFIQVEVPKNPDRRDSDQHYLFYFDAYGKRKLVASNLEWRYRSKKERQVVNDSIAAFFESIK